MGRYRKILVAADGSESSKNAFRQACAIGRLDKSWITVITTIPAYLDQYQLLNIREKVSAALHEEGKNILAEIGRIASEEDAFIKTILDEGSPYTTIVDRADEGNFDLIVMGRHGRKGVERMERALVGSVTARVIGNSQRDVLVIPQAASIGWNTILFATDGSKYSASAMEKAIDLARSYGGRLMAVSVVDVTEEFLAQAPEAVERLVETAKEYLSDVKERAAAAGVAVDTLVREAEAHHAITQLAAKNKADVIIMGSHGRTGVRRLLMGSVTEKVIGYAPCPVLVVRT